MVEMREIVDIAVVGRLFALLAITGPVTGGLIGVAIGAQRRNVRRGVTLGLLAGMLGPLNWLLWRLYNALTDRNGLDTVWNLVVNLVLFVIVGAAIGFGVAWARRKTTADVEKETIPSAPS